MYFTKDFLVKIERFKCNYYLFEEIFKIMSIANLD